MKIFKTDITAIRDNINVINGYLCGKIGKGNYDILATLDDNIVIVINNDEDALAFKLSEELEIIKETIKSSNSTKISNGIQNKTFFEPLRGSVKKDDLWDKFNL